MRDLLRNRGHNSAMMAYGITAAGKTYTIEGTKEQPGVMPRALLLLFEGLASHAEPIVARASYYEVKAGGRRQCEQNLPAVLERRACHLSAGPHSTDMLPPVTCTCVQVYNEQIYDLLDEQGVGPLGQRGALKLKEDALGRVFVAGLAEVRWPPILRC